MSDKSKLLEEGSTYGATESQTSPGTVVADPPCVGYHLISKIIVALLCGMAFGLAVHKSGVNRADILRDQFRLNNYIMLQVFMAATGVSTLMMLFIRLLPVDQHPYDKPDTACNKGIGWPATLIGTFMLGIGMSLAGACPGTVYAQIGSGSYRSLITILSMTVSCGIFGIVHPHIKHLQAYGVGSHEAISHSS